MIGKILALLGSVENNSNAAVETDDCAKLFEFEDGEWVIININDAENQSFGSCEADILENLLIEHPSMSVYQMKSNEKDLGSEEEAADIARPVPIRRHVSWQLAAWGSPLPSSNILLSVQRSRIYNDQRNPNRGALNRQNLAKTRFSSSERRYGYFKQPTQRLYNF